MTAEIELVRLLRLGDLGIRRVQGGAGGFEVRMALHGATGEHAERKSNEGGDQDSA